MEDLIFLKKELERIELEIEKNKELLFSKEKEITILANQEIKRLEEKKKEIEQKIQDILHKKPQQEAIILEMRAGVGGEEACLWTRDLFEIYLSFAKKNNWQVSILDVNYSSEKGIKEIILEIKGKGVFEKMKWEGGVHRVQRIPKTERKGRVHTSTATVAVLPQPKEVEFKINPQDLKIEFKKASGRGGQYVNKRMSAVRITHLPTAISVECQSERSQIQNKEMALKILRAKLYQMEKENLEKEISEQRKKQIGQAKRTEKIRTYNFQENRVTDHRLNKTWKNLDKILEGDLDLILKEFSFQKEEKEV